MDYDCRKEVECLTKENIINLDRALEVGKWAIDVRLSHGVRPSYISFFLFSCFFYNSIYKKIF